MIVSEAQGIVNVLCYRTGISIPFVQIKSLPSGILGKFSYKDYSITIIPTDKDTMIRCLYHEYRHAWQYNYYRYLYLSGLKEQSEGQHLNLMKILEDDAECYEKSLGRQGLDNILDEYYCSLCYETLNDSALEYALAVRGHRIIR